MGQSSSTSPSFQPMGEGTSFKVVIIHRYMNPTPSGWITGGKIEFNVDTASNPTVSSILRNINEYRSPGRWIRHLRDEHGNILSATTPADESPFYI